MMGRPGGRGGGTYLSPSSSSSPVLGVSMRFWGREGENIIFTPPCVRPGRSARPSPFPRGRTPRPSSCWRRPRGPGCSLHPGICGCCPIIISITITIIIISIGCISPIQHQHHHHNHYHHYHRLHQPPFSISIIMHCICSRCSSSVCSILFRVRIRGATLLARNGDWISGPNRNDGCISP